MCSQVLFTGKVACHDYDSGELTAEIDYGPISKTVLAKPWSDPTADPLADLKAAQRLVSGACGFSADFVCMGKDAGDAFEANAKVMEGYNKIFIQQGTLTPEIAQYGVVLLGHLARNQPLRLRGAVQDRDGTMKYFVPPKEVLVAASASSPRWPTAESRRSPRRAAACKLRQASRVPLVYWDVSGEDYRRLRLWARRIPIPGNTQSWTVLQALA